MRRHYLLGIKFTLMTHHSGLKYLFVKPRLNARRVISMATLNEFNFEIMYIKGKENKAANTLSKRIQVNYLAVVSYHTLDLKEKFKSARLQDKKYQQVREKLLPQGEDEEYRLASMT